MMRQRLGLQLATVYCMQEGLHQVSVDLRSVPRAFKNLAVPYFSLRLTQTKIKPRDKKPIASSQLSGLFFRKGSLTDTPVIDSHETNIKAQKHSRFKRLRCQRLKSKSIANLSRESSNFLFPFMLLPSGSGFEPLTFDLRSAGREKNR